VQVLGNNENGVAATRGRFKANFEAFERVAVSRHSNTESCSTSILYIQLLISFMLYNQILAYVVDTVGLSNVIDIFLL
jgi:hypothetical protein